MHFRLLMWNDFFYTRCHPIRSLFDSFEVSAADWLQRTEKASICLKEWSVSVAVGPTQTYIMFDPSLITLYSNHFTFQSFQSLPLCLLRSSSIFMYKRRYQGRNPSRKWRSKAPERRWLQGFADLHLVLTFLTGEVRIKHTQKKNLKHKKINSNIRSIRAMMSRFLFHMLKTKCIEMYSYTYTKYTMDRIAALPWKANSLLCLWRLWTRWCSFDRNRLGNTSRFVHVYSYDFRCSFVFLCFFGSSCSIGFAGIWAVLRGYNMCRPMRMPRLKRWRTTWIGLVLALSISRPTSKDLWWSSSQRVNTVAWKVVQSRMLSRKSMVRPWERIFFRRVVTIQIFLFFLWFLSFDKFGNLNRRPPAFTHLVQGMSVVLPTLNRKERAKVKKLSNWKKQKDTKLQQNAVISYFQSELSSASQFVPCSLFGDGSQQGTNRKKKTRTVHE